MCEILLRSETTLNNSSSKASTSDDVSPDCDKQKSSSSEKLPIESYGVKGAKHYPESSSRPRIHHHRHNHSKSLKKKDTAFSSNVDRYTGKNTQFPHVYFVCKIENPRLLSFHAWLL